MKSLNVLMKECCCSTCGEGRVRTYEKEDIGLDPKTLIPQYEYREYTWYSLDDHDEAKHFENVAETLNGTLVVNNGDSELSTKEEYEEFLIESSND